MKAISLCRGTWPLLCGSGLLLLVSCAQLGIGSGRDSIHLVGHGDDFPCDDPAYATVKKIKTFKLRFHDGSQIDLCRSEGTNAFSPEGACPDFRCENPSQYGGDLVIDVRSEHIDLSDAVAMFQAAKLTGNMSAAWTAIQIVLRIAPRQADDMWSDFWHTLVTVRFANRPQLAVEALEIGADHGLASAMVRLSEVYSKGEFGEPINSQLSDQWKSKASTAKAQGIVIPRAAKASIAHAGSPNPPSQAISDPVRNVLLEKGANVSSYGGAELHAIGVYEGPVHRPSNPSGSKIDVRIHAKSRPIVLALFNYEAVMWSITSDDGVVIREIILSGAFPSQVSGIDEGAVKITRLSIGLAYDDKTFKTISPKLKESTGLDVKSFQGGYRGTEFSVHER